jgi:hypothetical protein
MPPAPGQEEPIKRISKIVDWLITRQDLQPFLEPVDWRGLELYDYPKIISKMMDLGTIKRRLERGQYSTTHQIAEDIRLVWKNCMAYNSDGYVKAVCFCGVCVVAVVQRKGSQNIIIWICFNFVIAIVFLTNYLVYLPLQPFMMI